MAATKVLVGGVFDCLHIGHIRFLEAARALGDSLTVVVAYRNQKRESIHTLEQRICLVGSLSMVDRAIGGDPSDMFATVLREKPDIIALGYDQHNHAIPDIAAGCSRVGLDDVRIVRLDHTKVPGISTSHLLAELV